VVAALRESEERYRLLVELSPDAILVESEGRIVFANTAAQRLFRVQRPADLQSHGLLSLAAPGCRTGVVEAIRELEQDGFCPTVEEQVARLDGTIADVAVTRISFAYGGRAAIQMVVRDISERKRLEKQLQYQASHDMLTGLANRNLLQERLRQAIAYAARYGHPVWVAFLDLDRFKVINDSLGHKAGDIMLKAIAERLHSASRETDTVARLGGDEFVLILPERADGGQPTGYLQRIIDTVAQPLTIAGHEFSVSCSIGVAVYPTDGTDPGTLVAHADIAMYRA
jgi:diguanylate cyclase (GGDEF)-like protein/PAS domain S-box-containing protein